MFSNTQAELTLDEKEFLITFKTLGKILMITSNDGNSWGLFKKNEIFKILKMNPTDL